MYIKVTPKDITRKMRGQEELQRGGGTMEVRDMEKRGRPVNRRINCPII
jgi:hypothetical protein